MDRKMLRREFTTVTPFSKAVALGLFILLPIGAFYWGTLYQHILDAGSMNQYVNHDQSSVRVIYIRPSISPSVVLTPSVFNTNRSKK